MGKTITPVQVFHAGFYLKHNSKRQEHLGSLNLPIEKGMTVLETGAGIGDHTDFFVKKGCAIVPTEGRNENFLILKKRYKNSLLLDLEKPTLSKEPADKKYDIVYCYGTLYHLGKPLLAIDYLSKKCNKYFLLETCVSFGDKENIGICNEPVSDFSQSVSGIACRPTRSWIFNRLKERFEFVYMPTTQPNHAEFPEDWSVAPETKLFRSVFIASRVPIDNELLVQEIPLKQVKI